MLIVSFKFYPQRDLFPNQTEMGTGMGERQQGDKIEIVLVTLYFSHHKLLLGAKRIKYLVNERKINKQTNSLSFFPPLDLTIFEKGMLKISYQDYRSVYFSFH